MKLLLILSSLASFSALGQNAITPVSVPPQTAPQTRSATSSGAATSAIDYSGEPIVIEKLESVYAMNADGTGYRQQTIVARVQSESSVKQLGVIGIPFAGNSERVEIDYVRVRKPDGSVTETAASAAIEMPSPVTTAAPFYSDLKQMQLPVRNLRVGDKLEWQAKVIQTKSEAPGEFWGQQSFVSDAVTLSETLELRVPKDSYVNVWSPKCKPTETVLGAERIYHWESAQTKPTVGKAADAEKELKKKQIWTAEEEMDAKEGKLPDVAWTTFKSWQAVGDWYRALESDRVVPDAEVKAKVAELVAGKATEEEKVRAVYGYTSGQIRYIGVAFGIGRYRPHLASEVLENQYGDCKDKHTLLAAMLTVLGLHPDAALIGAGIRFNEAVPSPAAFNHLITTVEVNGQQVWLDATAEVAPYRMLSYPIRDKEALVVPEKEEAKLERTPAKPPFDSYSKMQATGTLDKDGVSNSRLTFTLRGDDEMQMRAAFRQISAAQYGQLVQQLSQAMGYGGTTSNVEVSRLEDTAEPLTISYDYKREKAGDWENYRIVPQVEPVTLPRVEDSDPPVQAIALGVPRVESSTSAMKLPEGWSAELPEAIHAKSAYATYDETYRFDQGTVYAELRIEVLKEKVPVSDWKSYKKWADEAGLGNERYIQLTGMGGKNSSGGSGKASMVSNAEAVKLIASARSAVQRHELDDAEATLNKAKDLNPEQRSLWASYGYVDFQRGNMTKAIADYRKELELHPDNYGTNASLAEAQKILGQDKEAETTLKNWASAQPENPAPVLALVSMLLDEGDPAGAVEAAKAGMAHPVGAQAAQESLQLLLGRAQLAAGLKDDGHRTLLALMQAATSPGMMNDSAYELANAGMEIPLAEQTARKALAQMVEESRTWTLDENTQTLLGKSRQIEATWDTIGWILFREGKLDEAQDYIKAAWRSRQSAEVGEHLAAIAEARGDKDEALHACELALTTFPAYLRPGVRKTPGAKQKELTEKAEALRKAGAKSLAVDVDKQFQALRVVSLGPANGVDGTAEYRLLLSGGRVEKLEAVDAKNLPGASDKIMTAKLDSLWPKDSQAKLVRSGFLNCHADICELILAP